MNKFNGDYLINFLQYKTIYYHYFKQIIELFQICSWLVYTVSQLNRTFSNDTRYLHRFSARRMFADSKYRSKFSTSVPCASASLDYGFLAVPHKMSAQKNHTSYSNTQIIWQNRCDNYTQQHFKRNFCFSVEIIQQRNK